MLFCSGSHTKSITFGLESVFDHKVLEGFDDLPKVTLPPVLFSNKSSKHVANQVILCFPNSEREGRSDVSIDINVINCVCVICVAAVRKDRLL
jgi:hypothetical protein